MNDWIVGFMVFMAIFALIGPADCKADGLNNLPYQPMIIDPEEAPHYYYHENPCGEPDTYSAPHEKVHRNDIAIPEPSPFYLLLVGGVVALGWRRL